MRCFNEQSSEYQQLQKAAGISEFKLHAFVAEYFDRYNSFPHLDQIPGANSRPYLELELNIKGDDFATTTKLDLAKLVGEGKSLTQTQLELNNYYRDLEIELIETGTDSVVITIKKRPSLYGDIYAGDLDINPDKQLDVQSSEGVLINIVQRLSNLYGVPIKNLTSDDINASAEWKSLNVDEDTAAFIYNNTIYINTSVARADAPLHELMHLIMGLIAVQDPGERGLYQTLLGQILQLPYIDTLLQDHIGKSMTDALEEIFVSEYSKYILDPTSDTIFHRLNEDLKANIFYNISRAIDSALMGVQSAASMPENQLWSSSLSELAIHLGSLISTPNYLGSLDLDAVQEHREIANIKELLMGEHKLTLDCSS